MAAECGGQWAEDMGIVGGPTALFPVWGVALAVATLGYYYRRRGPCSDVWSWRTRQSW